MKFSIDTYELDLVIRNICKECGQKNVKFKDIDISKLDSVSLEIVLHSLRYIIETVYNEQLLFSSVFGDLDAEPAADMTDEEKVKHIEKCKAEYKKETYE